MQPSPLIVAAAGTGVGIAVAALHEVLARRAARHPNLPTMLLRLLLLSLAAPATMYLFSRGALDAIGVQSMRGLERPFGLGLMTGLALVVLVVRVTSGSSRR